MFQKPCIGSVGKTLCAHVLLDPDSSHWGSLEKVGVVLSILEPATGSQCINRQHFLWVYRRNKPLSGDVGRTREELVNHEPKSR